MQHTTHNTKHVFSLSHKSCIYYYYISFKYVLNRKTFAHAPYTRFCSDEITASQPIRLGLNASGDCFSFFSFFFFAVFVRLNALDNELNNKEHDSHCQSQATIHELLIMKMFYIIYWCPLNTNVDGKHNNRWSVKCTNKCVFKNPKLNS